MSLVMGIFYDIEIYILILKLMTSPNDVQRVRMESV